MKRYRHYRLGLLVGLLSLHTLSACVHTRKELGYWPTCNTPRLCKIATVTSLLAPVMYYFYHFGIKEDGLKEWWGGNDSGIHYNSNGNRMNCFNVSSQPISTGWNTTIMPYVNSTQADAIIHAVQLAQAKFAINGKPYDGVTLMDPMVLDDQIIKEIKADDFSPKIIACWLNQGLNIEAKDPEVLTDRRDTTNWTLFMYAAFRSNKPAMQFLLAQGADVNTQDNNGNTSLAIAAMRGDPDIVDFLLKNKADPCIKNKYGETAWSLAKCKYQYRSRAIILAKLEEAAEKFHKTKPCHLAE